jgi:hypothetical protein
MNNRKPTSFEYDHDTGELTQSEDIHGGTALDKYNRAMEEMVEVTYLQGLEQGLRLADLFRQWATAPGANQETLGRVMPQEIRRERVSGAKLAKSLWRDRR